MLKIIVGNITRREEVIKDPATTTPRQVLEEQDLDYSMGQTALDGVYLKTGEMDKTFAELGVRSAMCHLMISAKQSNAAKVLCLGSAVVIRSDVPLATIEAVQRYRPEFLEETDWKNGKETTVFKVCATPEGAGSLSEYGASFSPHGSTNGEGVITINIPDTVADRREYIKTNYGKALIHLNDMEKRIQKDYDSGVKEQIEQVSNMIEIL